MTYPSLVFVSRDLALYVLNHVLNDFLPLFGILYETLA